MREDTIIKLLQEVNKEYAEYMIQETIPKIGANVVQTQFYNNIKY